VVSDEKLKTLAELSRFVYNRGALPWRDSQPYVGRSAFAHKGGVHVSAVLREESAYEHVQPELVGNQRRVLISELSGRSNIAAVFGDRFGLERFPEKRAELLERVQNLESEGYQFESAEASFELLARKVTGQHAPFFALHGFRVSSEVREDGREVSEATIKVAVNEQPEHTAAEGNGPVSALDHALRKALLKFYPELAEISLVNYTVRIVNPKAATDARVMVHITTQDNPTGDRWRTVGVSENVIQASWLALVDAIEYKLFRTRARAEAKPPAAAGGGDARTGKKK
jgi:2-isopropylmalate synthase